MNIGIYSRHPCFEILQTVNDIYFVYIQSGLRKPLVTLNSMLTVVLRNKIACFIHKDNSSLNYATDRNE